MTRREFHLALITCAVAMAGRSGAQERTEQTADTSPAAVINAWLPAPLPAEQAQKVAQAVKSMQKTLESLRACPLLEGSEPALIFQPHPPRKEKR